jgi:hypothetical protein
MNLETSHGKTTYYKQKFQKKIQKKMAKVIRHTLTLRDILVIAGNEEEILETAIQLKIHFTMPHTFTLLRQKSYD